MKFVHLSDLHLGKRVNEYSMLEDQEYILTKIINIIDDEKPACVIIAGDVYDKSIPSAEAVQMFDDFLTRLAKRNLQVFVISGNHDSPERMSFGSRLMNQSGIHISQVYNGKIEPFAMKDEHGIINVYMLPFVKPAHVKRFSDESIESYTDAIRVAVAEMNVDQGARNLLITHQFVTGATRSESEDISVGGSDNVDVTVFDDFDYVALGHIHSPQNCTTERVRYCGTPLKYSFSEAKDNKSITVVELEEKGNISVKTVSLLTLALPFGCVGCSNGSSASYDQISGAEAKALMDGESGYVIIDARTQEEYDEGHIPGAILIPYGEIADRAEKELPDKDQLILVYIGIIFKL